LFGNSNEDEGNNSDLLRQIQSIINLASGLFAGQPPLVYAKAKSPSVAEIEDGEPNKIQLFWASPNSTCKANNNWLSRNGESNSTLKKKGDNVGKSGSLTISLPLAVPATLKINGTASSPVVTQNSSLTSDLMRFSLSGIQSGDKITLTVGPQSINITAATSSPALIVDALMEKINSSNLPNSYEFNFGTSNISIGNNEPAYLVTCTASNGDTKTLPIQ
jgi:hypothetical protein